MTFDLSIYIISVYAGIPQVGMIILMTVLGSVGLPVDYMGFIMPLGEWG